MSLSDFLNGLGNPEPIIFSNHKYRIGIEDIPKYSGKSELHFIPNVGGVKSSEITELKAVFIDLDCGKDKSGNYFPPAKVEEYKNEKLSALSSFKCLPSAIVETRNGLQIFWFLNSGLSVEKWKIIQGFLISYFGADKKVCSVANQMRLPETYWVKDRNHKFYCKIIQLNNRKYNYSELLYAIDKSIELGPGTESKQPQPENKKVFTSYQSLFYHLTREIDLFDYIKTFYNIEGNNPKSFKCICHNDNNPSANVFKANGGIWLYCCRSNSCDFKIGNIVQLVAYKENVSRHKALRIICHNLGIIYEENQEHKLLLEDNLHTLKDIEYSHPDLYKCVRRYIRTLVLLHYIAIDNLEYTNENNGFVFSGSTRYLASILGRADKKTTGEDINYLALLEMIKKVDINSVSKSYQKMILQYRDDNNQYRHINLYSIPIHNQITLNHSNDIAKMIKEKGLRKKDFSYETIANAFGTEIADKVFPQVKNSRVKPLERKLLEAIEKSLDSFGFFTLQKVKEYFYSMGWRFSEKTYIRQLPQIVELFNLKKIKATNELKEKYNIPSKGYPYIYVKK